MPRKRKRRTRRETMASTLLMSEAKRFCRDLQYLATGRNGRWIGVEHFGGIRTS